ncbi:hypothetical protein H9Y04_43590 [Streptomyces sp. TRM66268-LWL]|uniref:Uncharacterized protein n=1 Tax=Streptomyces polyasparticus TaxID=2767826 RepID=A0ABR7SVA9_9ACTN|nr:hypothetical protein [Streptomyces polyasparticus]MBC9719416.1 hypothetical protein [Streptomyces polyasparticus]
MHPQYVSPARDLRLTSFLHELDPVDTPPGEPNLTVRELLIAVYRASTTPAAVRHPHPHCGGTPTRSGNTERAQDGYADLTAP